MKGKRSFKIVALLIIAVMLTLAACSGGGSNNNNSGGSTGNNSSNTGGQSSNNSGNSGSGSGNKAEEKPAPMKISIMIPSFSTELPDKSSPVWQRLEEYTNTDLEILFTPNSSYEDKLNITLASGDLPTIMNVGKTPSVISAARNGAFWDITDYLKDYPNLSQAHPVVLNNTSIDGRIYGVYRARTLGRMGVTYNKVWLDNLGLQPAKTIDEFYNILRAFTYDDPDGNGKNDTYGIVVSKYTGPWDIMQIWFGAPNKWGENENGELIPDFMTPEYREALKFFRKIYSEGLVNEDFAVMDSAAWNTPFVNGQAGVFVDVADNARRLNNSMQEAAPRDESYTIVTQAPVGPKGHRDMPTSGWSGMLVISKTKVKTEEELRRVLDFLDKLNDVEMKLLLGYGIEGRHYDMVDGYVVPKEDLDPALGKERNDLNQLLMFIGEQEPGYAPTPINAQIAEVQKANEAIVVGNPAEPFVSEVYAQVGQQLDNIIGDARIQYIIGQIDDAGFDAAIELWKKTGGDDYIREINELYKAAKGK